MDLEKKYRDDIKKELDEICGTKKVVIWGAGSYGYNVFQVFKKYKYDEYVVAFCDNCESKWNTTIEDLEILNYKQIKEKYKDDVVFLICSEWKKEIENQLINLGEQNNIYTPNIMPNFNSILGLIYNRRDYNENKERFDRLINNVNMLLEDDESKKSIIC